MICDLTIGLCLAKRMTINFGCLYDKFLVGNYKILLFCPFLFTVDFKALCQAPRVPRPCKYDPSKFLTDLI